MEIRKYSASDKRIWDEFVAKTKNATFLHFRNYMDYHADRFADCSLMAFNDKGKLVAVLPANRSGDTLHSHQGLTYGGWLTPTRHFNAATMMEVFDAMMNFLRQERISRLVYKAVPYIYHRYPADEDIYALFRNGAQILASNMSSVIVQGNTLARSDRRVRRTLELAEQKRVTVAPDNDMAAFWKILSDNLREKYNATPVHTLEEIKQLQALFPENIRLYMAHIEDEPVAGAVMFYTNDVAHVQYSSATPLGSECGALAFLFNKLIAEYCQHYRYFDFGTSNEDGGRYLNENLIRMKAGFGARGVAFNIYSIDVK